MDLKACYQNLGGDFDEVLGRLRREPMIEKFVFKFLSDDSFQLFKTSMENQDYDEALRGVHTLKGICQNLAFTRLFRSSEQMTSTLREHDIAKAAELAPQLAEDYAQTIRAIEAYRSAREGEAE